MEEVSDLIGCVSTQLSTCTLRKNPSISSLVNSSDSLGLLSCPEVFENVILALMTLFQCRNKGFWGGVELIFLDMSLLV